MLPNSTTSRLQPRRGAAGIPRVHCLAVLAIVLWAPLVLTGCGRSGPVRHDVRGAVRYKDKPLPRGSIRFEPDASRGNPGPVGIASIVDGAYTTTAAGATGTLEGPLVVWISGWPAADPQAEMVRPFFENHRVEVDFRPAKRGPTTLDFDIPGTVNAP